MSAHVARPLEGCRVAVTRAPDQAAGILERLRDLGAEPIACPTIAIEPPARYDELDDALRSIDRYNLIVFTSANAVTSVAGRVSDLGLSISPKVQLAAVGEVTARALAERIRSADFVPHAARAEALGTELADIAGRRVLFPRGDLAGETLGRVLRARGATVDEVVVYRTVAGSGARDLARLVRSREVDAILFMSASSVRYLIDAMRGSGGTLGFGPAGPAVICIGPGTMRAALDAGVGVDAMAHEMTADGIVKALERWYRREDNAAGR